jgi:YjbE family integral membrane protein
VVESLTAILSIIVIDLVLSGDNAVVIGMAARSLSVENRRKAIVFGGAGAIGLRILFTALATVLLGIPYLQAIGGALLFYIAYKLLRPQGDGHGEIKEAGSLREAIQTIILADVVMSLDNILAVAGAAHGNIRLLMFGLLLSIPIILFGSELVARLLGRFPAFLYVGAFGLVHAAVAMILHDASFEDRFHTVMWQELALSLAITATIVGLVRLLERTNGARSMRVASTGVDPHG